MQISPENHLAYCTNIHPAETWQETFEALCQHTLSVRDKLKEADKLKGDLGYAIGLRLSQLAAKQLLEKDQLSTFKKWLEKENCYVFTINGFPYGAFHDTRVKENVYKPDWTSPDRLAYTKNLFTIIAELCPKASGGSVSTLPGSFKEFQAAENLIFENLFFCALHIHELAEHYDKDLHLGLEPEPLGHFENTEETITFFERFITWAEEQNLDTEIIRKYIGVNYDTCHFALEFDDCTTSLDAFANHGIRISKIHLSNALEIDPSDKNAMDAIKHFDEPTYLHQFMVQQEDTPVQRYRDLPEYLADPITDFKQPCRARIHFHIPLYAEPEEPLGSTKNHAEEALAYLWANPETCPHIEMETYTWGVLPNNLQKPMVEQIVEEYLWTLKRL